MLGEEGWGKSDIQKQMHKTYPSDTALARAPSNSRRRVLLGIFLPILNVIFCLLLFNC